MTNKSSTQSTMQASIPMNLFASWDIDRSSSNCIPRVCTINITRLVMLDETNKDISSVFVATKMQHSKRILRSNEIMLNGNAVMCLELIFSIQYPHIIKREQNKLQILIQRRKRYKNRAILGYKTLAVTLVDMEELIQYPRVDDSVLQLYSTSKDAKIDTAIAQIFVKNFTTLPVNMDPDGFRLEKITENDRSPDADNYSEDDVDSYSSDAASDNLPDYNEDSKIKNRRKIRLSSSSRQQNFIKTKVTAILRKFKQGLGEEIAQNSELPENDQVNLDFLYDELEDFNTSDSCPELDDTISIISTPKPKLRPFFDRISHSSSQTEINESKKKSTATLHSQTSFQQSDSDNTATINSTTRDSENEDDKISLLSNTSDSLQCVPDIKKKTEIAEISEAIRMAFADENLPRVIVLADINDKFAQAIINLLYNQHTQPINAFFTRVFDEIRNVFSILLNRLQKYVNSTSKPISPVKVVIIGNEVYFNQILRQYVDRMSGRSPDLQSLLLFFIIPQGHHVITRHLSSVDGRYSSSFNDVWWKEKFVNEQHPADEDQMKQIANRVKTYINSADQVFPICISEVMLTFRQTGNGDEGPSQQFVPFISDVKVGVNDTPTTIDSDKEEAIASVNNQSNQLSNSNIQSVQLSPSTSNTATSSPTVLSSSSNGASTSQASNLNEIKLGLQVDYWKDKDQTKVTLKSNFKSFLVTCQHQVNEHTTLPSNLVLEVVTKGKKNIMRLPGKKLKEKDSESKSHEIITRLICTSKHHHTVLRVTIDGVEWKDVKFFQISSTWSSHIKTIPVSIFGVS